MGILDEAIREHLELKRRHGAEHDELRQLEDEAFGQADRPSAEGATDGSAASEAETTIHRAAPEDPRRSEREEIARQPTENFDVFGEEGKGESPGDIEVAGDAGSMEAGEEPSPGDTGTSADDETAAGRGSATTGGAEDGGDTGAGGADESATQSAQQDDGGGGDSGSAADGGIEVPDLEQPPPPPADSGPGLDEMPEATSSSEAPREPAAERGAGEAEGSDSGSAEAPEASSGPDPVEERFSERSLSEELDQALDVDTPSARPSIFDEESDEYRLPQRPRRHERPEPDAGEEGAAGEGDADDEAEDAAGEPEERGQNDTEEFEAEGEEQPPAGGETGEEDVLEETPEFLEETPEHDRLWFEQKPPKDFDFND